MKKIIIFILAVISIPIIVITVSNVTTFLRYLRRGYDIEKIISIMNLTWIQGLLNIIWMLIVVLLLIRTYHFISFVFKRIVIYFKLSFSCIKFKCKFRLKRFPLASIFKIREKEDILIKNKEKTFYIHFIDVVGRARVFSIVNENEYNIARTTPDAPKSLGAAYGGGATGAKLAAVMSSTISNGKTMKFPKFDTSVGEHIIILDPLPMEVRYIDSGAPKPLFSGYSVGDITYYEANDFIKLLKKP